MGPQVPRGNSRRSGGPANLRPQKSALMQMLLLQNPLQQRNPPQQKTACEKAERKRDVRRYAELDERMQREPLQGPT